MKRVFDSSESGQPDKEKAVTPDIYKRQLTTFGSHTRREEGSSDPTDVGQGTKDKEMATSDVSMPVRPKKRFLPTEPKGKDTYNPMLFLHQQRLRKILSGEKLSSQDETPAEGTPLSQEKPPLEEMSPEEKSFILQMAPIVAGKEQSAVKRLFGREEADFSIKNKSEAALRVDGFMKEICALKRENVAYAKNGMFDYINTLEPRTQEELKLMKQDMQHLYAFHCEGKSPGAPVLAQAWERLHNFRARLPENDELFLYLNHLMTDTNDKAGVKREALQPGYLVDKSSDELGTGNRTLDADIFDSMMEIDAAKFPAALDELKMVVRPTKEYDDVSLAQTVKRNLETVYDYIKKYPGDQLLREGGFRAGKAVTLWKETYCCVLASHPKSTVRKVWDKLHGNGNILLPAQFYALENIHELGVERVKASIMTIQSRCKLLAREKRGLGQGQVSEDVYSRLKKIRESLVDLTLVRDSLNLFKAGYFHLPLQDRPHNMFEMARSYSMMSDVLKCTEDEVLQDLREDILSEEEDEMQIDEEYELSALQSSGEEESDEDGSGLKEAAKRPRDIR